jgi:hypothetical protein
LRPCFRLPPAPASIWRTAMNTTPANDLFHGLFEWQSRAGATPTLAVTRGRGAHCTVPCPETGRPLRVASVEVSDRAVCPACTQLGAGGYVSFVADLRLAFACPSCRKLVWIACA